MCNVLSPVLEGINDDATAYGGSVLEQLYLVLVVAALQLKRIARKCITRHHVHQRLGFESRNGAGWKRRAHRASSLFSMSTASC